MFGSMLHSNWYKSSGFSNIHRGYIAYIYILLKQYRSSSHQFELKMVATTVMPLQERESFHLFLLNHLNVRLKIELFLLQWI